DGIRDATVTGVQTCALPICSIVNAHSEHEYYPPLVPLLETWLYVHRGLVSIDLGKTVWALVGDAFAVCLAWHLRLSVGRGWPAQIGRASCRERVEWWEGGR